MNAPWVWDTSALVNWGEWYPRELMPDMWRLLDELRDVGDLLVPRAVVMEVGSGDDVAGWVRSLPKALVWAPSTHDLEIVRRVQSEFPALAPRASRPNVADAYVVAAAVASRGTVVTDDRTARIELGTGPPYSKKHKMDAACTAYGVACCTSREFMKRAMTGRR